MKLSEIVISNYRSFGEEPTKIKIDKFTGLIGHNSAGKSTILNALNTMFGKKRLKRDDFHTVEEEQISEKKLYIEAKFEFYQEENSDEYSIPMYFESFTVDEPGQPPFIVIRFEGSWLPSNTPEGLIDTKLSYVIKKNSEEQLKPVSLLEKSKIDVIYIPAIRDPYDQLSNASGTILWRLLKQINWKEEDKTIITESITALNDTISSQSGINLLEEVISERWKVYHNDSRFNEASIKFGGTELDHILKKLEVEFSPAPYQRPYKIKDLGDGLQSLFYLSLIDSFLKMEERGVEDSKQQVTEEERVLNTNPPAVTILLVEEPENHVSPHLLGNVLKNLLSISENKNSQVLFTSHSPSVIKRVNPENIRHIRLNIEKKSTSVNEILLPNKQDEAYKFIKEAVKAYPELYFSSLVILGEGDSEEILLPYFLNKFYPNLDFEGISIVPLGGRHVNHFWRLLNSLKIPFVTLLDLDKERYGGDWGRIKYAVEELIKIGSEIKNVNTAQGVPIENAIKSIGSWPLDNSELKSWIDPLEEYDVFFSSPLDIDFLMLENYKDAYIDSLSSSEGPVIDTETGRVQIRSIDLSSKEEAVFLKRVDKSVSNTLKEKGGDGDSYTKEQKELMIWYDYFFLGRGKPVTHLLALQNIPETQEIPSLFQRIGERVKQKLEGE